MTASTSSPLMTVRLCETTVALLMARRADERETLDALIARLAKATDPVAAPQPTRLQPTPRVVPPKRRRRDNDEKYALVMLGETLRAGTLGKVFAKVVDALATVDPAAIERLSTMHSRKRFFVAWDRKAIHPDRPDLPVLRSASGWWVSANIGTDDLERALRAVCQASSLSYGRDIRFLSQREPELP